MHVSHNRVLGQKSKDQKSEMFLFDPYKKYIQSNDFGSGDPY